MNAPRRHPLADWRLVFSLAVAAVFLVSVSRASAEVVVNLAGSGAGSVISAQTGGGGNKISCSNVGDPGGPGAGICAEEFHYLPTEKELNVELLAAPSSDSYFSGWNGDGFDGSCNSGAENPCSFTDYGDFGAGPFTITATFKLLPPPPVATTGGTASGPNEYLLTLKGSVNPTEFKVSDCHFEYGESLQYGNDAPCLPSASELGEGNADVAVEGEAETEQLKANTTYHYRLVASNIGGTSEGEDRTFTTGPAPPSGSCPNAALRLEQVIGSILLPDCMALEMVSPSQKDAQLAIEPVISADGERVVYKSGASLAEAPIVGPGSDSYVADRGSSGWVSAPTAPPGGSFRGGWESYAPARSFNPDFSSWFQITATQPQWDAGVGRVFRGGLGGLFAPLSPLLVPNVVAPGEGVPFVVSNSAFRGASADHSHLLFAPGDSGIGSAISPTSYLPGDPQPTKVESAFDRNTYIAHLDSDGKPSLELLARDDHGKAWGGNCGARLGGVGPLAGSVPINGYRNQGAISPDGSRVYLSARVSQPASGKCDPTANKLRILERLESPKGPWIGPLFGSECTRVSPPCSSADGDDLYQGASADGTLVYFTTSRQLANSDLDESELGEECSTSVAVPGCDLYLYDSSLPAGHRLIQVSAGENILGEHEAGKEAAVYNGVAAISGDGSHVYFVAEGVLSSDSSPKGGAPVAGQPNFYVWDRADEAISFIGTLVNADGGIVGLWGSEGTFRNQAYPVPVRGQNAEAGGDDDVLVFRSKAALTSDDSDGGFDDLFRYDAVTEELERVSKAAPGGNDNGNFVVSPRGVKERDSAPGTDFAEVGRWVSEDGATVVFKTAEGLLPGDVNGVLDSYLWRNGQLTRLPGTADPSGQLVDFPTVSHDGSEVAFQSFLQLLPEDRNSNKDVYIARTDGGFASTADVEDPCQPDEALQGRPCQEGLKPTPGAPNTGSENMGTGNPAAKLRCPKSKRKVRHKGKVRCVKRNKRHVRHANTKRRSVK